jgi:hydroxyethylthiazole kinase
VLGALVFERVEYMEIVTQICTDLETIRERRPLVHSITNLVVMNETANAILCLGALPIMSHAVEEVEEMVGIASALVLNIGTLTPRWVEAMVIAGKRANERGIPVILDPVGAGATRLRTESSKAILDSVRVSVVRGNAGEVATLAGIKAEVRGVESIAADEGAESLAWRLASAYGCAVAVTGAVDVVSDGSRTALVSNGHPLMGKVVGTGCMSSVMVGSFAAVQEDAFVAAAGALTAFGVAGEIAAEASGDKPGTFHVELYNALYGLESDIVKNRARLEIKN